MTPELREPNIGSMTKQAAPHPTPTRRPIPPRERFLVWVRAAGCCEMCGRYLLEGPITARPYTLGELAHIVGQGTGPGSPRGQVRMSESERDQADNLMLLCLNEHDEIDREGSLDVATIEFLQSKKREHEEHVHRLVTMPRDRSTTILRVIGDVQGEPVQVPREVASAVVVRAGRFADYSLCYDRQGVEIDLRGIPGEADGTPTFWTAARAKIDEVVDTRLAEGIRHDAVKHLSVFAFARLPLLVYLGSKLDDTFPVEIYQRHRAGQGWDWTDSPATTLTVDWPASVGVEVVLVINVSGTIDITQLPDAIRALPMITLGISASPGVDAIASRETLLAFDAQVRDLFARFEVPSKIVRRVHVVAAMPVSAAVGLGRAHNPPIHPALVVYERTGNTYRAAVTIG